MTFDIAKLTDFPQLPGVYLMKNAKDEVLYVGKAKNLKARLRQYFISGSDGRPQIPYLLAQVHAVETIVVNSEKEALLLENTLIKRHQPRYNVLLKDDKGYICLKMTRHTWPMLELIRFKGKPPSDGELFGPYVHAVQARELFDLVGRLFPLRQCSNEEFARRTRPCLLYQIKRCSAPCVNMVTHEEYRDYVKGAEDVLRGDNKKVLKELELKMHEASENLEFEKAHSYLEKIELIRSTFEKQNVELISEPDTDIWGIYREGPDVVISKLMYRARRLVGSCVFEFDNCFQENDELLSSFLLQHYLLPYAKGEIPREIILFQKISEISSISEILSDMCKRKIHLVHPVRGEKRTLAELAITNAKYAFQQRKNAQSLREKALLDMQEKLHLSRFPRRIECFDNSHLSGHEAVSSMVVFVDGQKCKKEYRKYKIKEARQGDDYGMMREVLMRRYTKAKEHDVLPDVIIIDGGKGHLGVAEKVLKELNITSCNVISLAKEEGRHDKGLSQDRVFISSNQEPITLPIHSPILHLLQKIRDEAHRFTIEYQKVRRSKSTIKSALDAIPGIGPAKKRLLIKKFGSVQGIKQLSLEELFAVKGISKNDAENIFHALKTL